MAKLARTSKMNQPRRCDLELFMECEEEELTPSQKAASTKAQDEYKSALQKIEDAKTIRLPRTGPVRASSLPADGPTKKAKKRDIEDVIIIDDDPLPCSPAKQRRSSALEEVVSVNPNYSDYILSSGTSSAQTLMPSPSDIIFAPSTMSSVPSNMIPSAMFLSSHLPPYMTLPSPVASGMFVTLPVGSVGGQNFILPAGFNKLQMINSFPSLDSATKSQTVVIQEPAVPSPSTSQRMLLPAKSNSRKSTDVNTNKLVPKRPRKTAVAKSDKKLVNHEEPSRNLRPTKTIDSAKMAPVVPEVVPGTSGLGIRRPAGMTFNVDPVMLGRPMNNEPYTRSQSMNKEPKARSSSVQNINRNTEKPNLRRRQEKQEKIIDVESTDKDSTPTTWIPLDEYYYGKKEGDPTYREEKGEYRFKCWYCHKMLYNNLRLMLHMQGHIDSDKQQNLDLSDLTQCRHCYKQFDTPFEMQCHIEKVHQNNSNVLVCRICEKDHDSQSLLRQHMKQFHQACEMPYVCQLCNYRSSIYSDVVDHFKKRHDSSQNMLCLYCLKVFKVSFYKTAGWGMTQNYYHHLQKHQSRGKNKKCYCCKLTFLSKNETARHQGRDHRPNYRGIQGGANSEKTVNRDKKQVLICLPEEQGVKLLNVPATSKVLEISVLHSHGVMKKHLCLECKKPMNTPDHYKNYAECTLCRFATLCNIAFSNHMMKQHSGLAMEKKSSLRLEKKMDRPMFCLCEFSSVYGSLIANHLASCCKRTCYSYQPEMKYFEYDDEQEDYTPFEPYVEESEILKQECSSSDADVPSLFGVLGLVKKPWKYDRRHLKTCGTRSRTATNIATGLIEEILDSMFPAEKAASEIIDHLMDRVEKAIKPKGGRGHRKAAKTTPPPPKEVSKLTGAYKWKTVKIADASNPSHKSIFLGSEPVLTNSEVGASRVVSENGSGDVDVAPITGAVELASEAAVESVSEKTFTSDKDMTKIEDMKPCKKVDNLCSVGEVSSALGKSYFQSSPEAEMIDNKNSGTKSEMDNKESQINTTVPETDRKEETMALEKENNDRGTESVKEFGTVHLELRTEGSIDMESGQVDRDGADLEHEQSVSSFLCENHLVNSEVIDFGIPVSVNKTNAHINVLDSEKLGCAENTGNNDDDDKSKIMDLAELDKKNFEKEDRLLLGNDVNRIIFHDDIDKRTSNQMVKDGSGIDEITTEQCNSEQKNQGIQKDCLETSEREQRVTEAECISDVHELDEKHIDANHLFEEDEHHPDLEDLNSNELQGNSNENDLINDRDNSGYCQTDHAVDLNEQILQQNNQNIDEENYNTNLESVALENCNEIVENSDVFQENRSFDEKHHVDHNLNQQSHSIAEDNISDHSFEKETCIAKGADAKESVMTGVAFEDSSVEQDVQVNDGTENSSGDESFIELDDVEIQDNTADDVLNHDGSLTCLSSEAQCSKVDDSNTGHKGNTDENLLMPSNTAERSSSDMESTNHHQNSSSVEHPSRDQSTEIREVRSQENKAQSHADYGSTYIIEKKGDSSAERKVPHLSSTNRSPHDAGSSYHSRGAGSSQHPRGARSSHSSRGAESSHHPRGAGSSQYPRVTNGSVSAGSWNRAAQESNHANYGYRHREDNRRDYYYDRGDGDRREYYQRDYDQRNFDRRDYDQRNFDRRDYDQRDYDHRDYRQYGRGENRYETYSQWNRGDRQDRYDEPGQGQYRDRDNRPYKNNPNRSRGRYY